MPPHPSTASLDALNALLAMVAGRNAFYAAKWRQAGVAGRRLGALAELAAFPFTTRAELIADQEAAPPLGTNLSVPLDDCKRFHRSSGTTHAPLWWADSADCWAWVLGGSMELWRRAGVQARDRILFPTPFQGRSGAWISFEGAARLGCACLPPGLLEPPALARALPQFRPTVLAGRPDDLATLAREAAADDVEAARLGVRRLILCGPHDAAARASLETLWGAECFDRYGLTEAGSVAGECQAHGEGLHLVGGAFIAECIEPATGAPVPDGEPGELVLTTLGRWSRPIIRYRTGDQVRLVHRRRCACGLEGPLLLDGVRRLTGRPQVSRLEPISHHKPKS